MIDAICEACQRPFPREKEYLRLCVPCYKEAQGYTLNQSDRAFRDLQLAFMELVNELKETRKERDRMTKARDVALDAVETAQASARAALRSNTHSGPTQGMTKKRAQALLKLCHPDRHGGSKLATEATKWLLEQRRRAL